MMGLKTTTFRLRGESGQALVEFAFVMPVLVFILLAIIQFGGTYNHYVSLTDGTRAGARKAVVSRALADPVTAAKDAVKASAPALNPAQLNITVTPAPPWTVGQQITVTATYPYSIDLIGIVVNSGNLTSTTKERVE
jgi:Flp pilus assembly protein TadG